MGGSSSPSLLGALAAVEEVLVLVADGAVALSAGGVVVDGLLVGLLDGLLVGLLVDVEPEELDDTAVVGVVVAAPAAVWPAATTRAMIGTSISQGRLMRGASSGGCRASAAIANSDPPRSPTEWC
jgi:hypothetical protein